MKRRTRLTLVACLCASVILFFYAPLVWTEISPCFPSSGYGYASISFYLFNVGEVFYVNPDQYSWMTHSPYLNDEFLWMTHSAAHCPI